MLDHLAAGSTAAHLDQVAEALTIRCHRLAAASATSEWDGPAAHAFRRSAHEVLISMRHAALQLHDAADATRRYASAAAAAAQQRAHDAEVFLHEMGGT